MRLSAKSKRLEQPEEGLSSEIDTGKRKNKKIYGVMISVEKININ